MEYLLQRQHVSALALGHYPVSNCASEETIQSSIGLAHIIQKDVVDNWLLLTIINGHFINEISLDDMS